MPKFIDLTGHRFGELTVLRLSDKRLRGRHLWVCQCDCGRFKESLASPLREGDLTCCGLHRTKSFLKKHSKPNPTKRKYPKETDSKSRLHVIWRAMSLRCNTPSHPAYNRYGGRGIKVCAEWAQYEAFRVWALGSGYAEHLTLDRIDNDTGYSPENCRWLTRKDQARNTRRNVWVDAFGERKLLVEWAEDARCGVSRGTLYKRINAGHSPETAMTADEHSLRSKAATERWVTCPAKHRASLNV